MDGPLDALHADESLRRHEYPVAAERVFLAHAGVCPLPRRVAAAMGSWLEAATRDDQEAVGAGEHLCVEGGAADDKHNHAGKVLALGLLLVPVAEPGAVGSLPVHGALALAAQEWEVVVVELVVDGVFDNILA